MNWAPFEIQKLKSSLPRRSAGRLAATKLELKPPQPPDSEANCAALDMLQYCQSTLSLRQLFLLLEYASPTNSAIKSETASITTLQAVKRPLHDLSVTVSLIGRHENTHTWVRAVLPMLATRDFLNFVAIVGWGYPTFLLTMLYLLHFWQCPISSEIN